MATENVEQLFTRLTKSPSDHILYQASAILVQAQRDDANLFISNFFDSILTLEQWSWEFLSRDTREWHDDELEYWQFFSDLSSLNIKLILNNNDMKLKQSLLFPNDMDTIDRMFQQIERRTNDEDQFLSVIILWFDTLALLIHEHVELTSITAIVYINERMLSDIIMHEQFKIYLQQLKTSSPSITTKQLFSIKTCLFSVSGYFYSKPDNYLYNGQQIIEYLGEDYTNIILLHSQTVSSWSKELLECITHLIGMVTACYWWIGSDNQILEMSFTFTETFNKYLDSLIDILGCPMIYEQIDQQWSNDQTILVETLLELLKYFVHFQNLKYYFREQKKLLETLAILDNTKSDRIALMTYGLQSELLSEKDMKELDITKEMNELFFDYLQKAWANPFKKYKKISIDDLLKDLLNLSTNDILRDALIDANQLTFLIELTDQYPIIYNILWSLSFDIRIQEQLRLHAVFINKLNNVWTNESMQRIIHGIQWNLNLNDTQLKTNTNNEKKFDMMISYSQKDKLVCTQLKNQLTSNGYHVCMELDEIQGNLLEAIVQAINQSRLVLVCISERYKRSSFCRAQAQYAFKKQLKMIPILVEKNYQADGWISFLIGNSSPIDFTDNRYSHAMRTLLNQLKNPQISVIDSLVMRQQPQNITNLPLSNLRSTDIRQWKKADVQQWLNDNHLPHLAQVLSDRNGLELIDLSKTMSENSSQQNLDLFQDDSMKKTGKNVSLIEIAKLHNLIEEQVNMPIKASKWGSKYCCGMM